MGQPPTDILKEARRIRRTLVWNKRAQAYDLRRSKSVAGKVSRANAGARKNNALAFHFDTIYPTFH